jgi:hypothetical protein
MTQVRSAVGTLQDQIMTEWDALASLSLMGDSQIISYHLQYDLASNGVTWYDVIGFNPTSLYLTTAQTAEIQGGLTYNYRVRA